MLVLVRWFVSVVPSRGFVVVVVAILFKIIAPEDDLCAVVS